MSHTVHLFIPCFIDQIYPNVGISTVKILETLGCDLVYPREQTCCGQPAFNSGYWKECQSLAERFLTIFGGAEYIVAPSGSCVSMVKKLYRDLPLGESEKRALADMEGRIYELSQFIGEILGVDKWQGAFSGKVTFHDACHGLRELGISETPRRLLQSIEGLDYVEMHRPDTCCGFGGTFSVKFDEISTEMVKDKARWAEESDADYLVSCDASCLMQIDGYLKRQGSAIKTLHLSEILWQAMSSK